MEFPFSSAVVSFHLHATEDEQRVVAAFRNFLLSSIEIKRSRTKGHHGNPILIFEARINQKKALKEIWRRLLSGLRADEFDKFILKVPERIDESCFFYLRFDKQAAYGGELIPTETGDAIHFRFKIAAFPPKREVAVELVKKFLEDRGKHGAEA